MAERTCAAEGCDRLIRARGLCARCYNARRHAGTLPLLDRRLSTRFWRNVQKTDDCWVWTASLRNGYGQLSDGGGSIAVAHRVSWELHYGPIPAGLVVCHRCDNPPCVRPDHLFLGTVADNLKDMRDKGRAASPPHRHGERANNAKLRDADVLEIRARHAAGHPTRVLAADKGVSTSTIRVIVRGSTWAHLL